MWFLASLILKHDQKLARALKLKKMRANAARAGRRARTLVAAAAKAAQGAAQRTGAGASETDVAAAKKEEEAQRAALAALISAAGDDDADRAGGGEEDESMRDQGFVRPTVLVLLPFRHSVLLFVRELIGLLTPPTGAKRMSVQNLERFEDQYGEEEEEEEAAKDGGKVKSLPPWRVAFPGNNDDMHQLGIAFSKRGARLKLFADFYDSDIIGECVI